MSDKPNERQRMLEGRITGLEAEVRSLNARLDEMSDQLAMMAHHMHRLREGDPLPIRRTH